MAFVTAPNRTEKPSVFAPAFAAIGSFVTHFIEVKSRAAEIERLQSMSDRQLADIGLERGDIARRVFGDMYFA